MNSIVTPERIEARKMYWRGYSIKQISDELDVPYGTVDSWKRRDEWDNASVAVRIGCHLDARLSQLIAKEDKTDRDFNEIDQLGKTLERTARIERYESGGNEADLNPKVRNRNKNKKRKAQSQKNYFSEEDINKLKTWLNERRKPHQLEWRKHHDKFEMRQYVKSRQIGATDYFSGEAFEDAVENGKNKIFISASKAQAHVFRRNIIKFARQACDIELKGDPIILGHNGAELHFLGTNKNTAQSYSGDLYIDEYFWIPKFKDIEHVASGMTVLDDRRITYFSTPSTVTHEAYPLWNGKHFNIDRPKSDHIDLDISHKALKEGRLCEDGHFRQMVTIVDAINKGFDLVTLDKLKKKFPPGKFENLLMCQFVNDMNSAFKLAELQKCMVDSWVVWKDFEPMAARPYGDRPVWIGYDPSRTIDNASLVVVAPPRVAGGKFRALEKFSWNGMDFDAQARKIKEICRCYHVEHIAIDASGMGNGVYELVKKFFPAVKKLTYNVELKNALVLKAKQLISHGRLEFDSGWADVAHAFMTIHQAETGSGRSITYKASRTHATGHADLAWALMHALEKEPLQAIDDTGGGTGSFMEIF